VPASVTPGQSGRIASNWHTVTRRSNADPDVPASIESMAPALNFKIPLAARVRAAAGVPACFLRKRRIEDLEASLLRIMRELLDDASAGAARKAAAMDEDVVRGLSELARLVAAHNRYYPIEANLPMSPRTGRLMERGQPWLPLDEPSFEALFARATRER